MTKYRVLIGLDYPTSASVVKRILGGEDVPMAERRMRRAEPGDIVTDIPEHSIPNAIEKGYVEEVTDG